MTIQNLLTGLFCVFFISVGQILFKLASKNIDFDGFIKFLTSILKNFYLISGLALYLFTTFLWISLLRAVDLKLAYPIMALAFIIVPVLSNIFLSEKVGFNTFAGGIFIVIGISISVR